MNLPTEKDERMRMLEEKVERLLRENAKLKQYYLLCIQLIKELRGGG